MGKKIEKRGDNVHELSPTDFIGAWTGYCEEKGTVRPSVRSARNELAMRRVAASGRCAALIRRKRNCRTWHKPTTIYRWRLGRRSCLGSLC